MTAENIAPSGGAALWVFRRSSPDRRHAIRLTAVLMVTGIITISRCGTVRATDALDAGYPSPAAATAPLAVATAASFRVETEVFEGTQVKPQSQHLLLFDEGVVYDLPLGAGTTVSVVDPLRSRVMLLHKVQQVRTSISTESLIQISAQARAAAIQAGAGNTLGLDARMMPGDAPNSYCIEFGGTKYTATIQPTLSQAALNEGMAAEYAAFTVWACRLNIARHVGSPPFARMTLADFLAAEKALPRQIKLDVRRGLKTRTYRSENLYVGRLGDLDRKRISEVGEMISSYTEVEFAAFPID